MLTEVARPSRSWFWTRLTIVLHEHPQVDSTQVSAEGAIFADHRPAIQVRQNVRFDYSLLERQLMQVSLAKTVESLEARRAVLADELAELDARLRAVAEAVQHPDDTKTLEPEFTKAPAPAAPSVRRSKRARRSWFAREEAVGLLRKVAKSPKAPADLVREVGRIKGYSGELSTDDEKRFQGAAYMAISQAVKTKALRRTPKGQLVAA